MTGSINDGDHVLETDTRSRQRRTRGGGTKKSIAERRLTLGVSNFQRAMSMVIPRSRSALSLSRTQAYLKDPANVEKSQHESPSSSPSLAPLRLLRPSRRCAHPFRARWPPADVRKVSARPHTFLISTLDVERFSRLDVQQLDMRRVGALRTFSNFSMVRLSIPGRDSDEVSSEQARSADDETRFEQCCSRTHLRT